PDKMVTFGFIWLALLVFVCDAVAFSFRSRSRIA
ncbi:MAG: EamA family transporter, partial [Pantoea agglomerans]